MTYLTAVAAAVGVVLGLCVLGYLVRVAFVWRRFRSERVVTCPETGHPAAVRIDVPHAVITELTRGDIELRLASCSRWPQRRPCDEACLPEAQDRASTVSAVAAQWYAGRNCIYCGKPVREDVTAGHRVAILGPDGITHEWRDVAADRLPDVLRTAWPVCWDCHVAQTFRREHPELVTDRERWPRTS